jgi:probable HAF family extracellular repeat protein
MGVFAMLAAPIWTAAQQHEQHTRYQVTSLGALPGATYAYGATINNRGWVKGESGVVPGSYPVPTHATVWRNGMITDLGTLGRL